MFIESLLLLLSEHPVILYTVAFLQQPLRWGDYERESVSSRMQRHAVTNAWHYLGSSLTSHRRPWNTNVKIKIEALLRYYFFIARRMLPISNEEQKCHIHGGNENRVIWTRVEMAIKHRLYNWYFLCTQVYKVFVYFNVTIQNPHKQRLVELRINSN